MSTVRETVGLACPNCQSDNFLQVELTTMAKLTSEGTDPFGDQFWDGNSFMRCDNCDHEGLVANFYTEEVLP
jgi:hypothetical protein